MTRRGRGGVRGEEQTGSPARRSCRPASRTPRRSPRPAPSPPGYPSATTTAVASPASRRRTSRARHALGAVGREPEEIRLRGLEASSPARLPSRRGTSRPGTSPRSAHHRALGRSERSDDDVGSRRLDEPSGLGDQPREPRHLGAGGDEHDRAAGDLGRSSMSPGSPPGRAPRSTSGSDAPASAPGRVAAKRPSHSTRTPTRRGLGSPPHATPAAATTAARRDRRSSGSYVRSSTATQTLPSANASSPGRPPTSISSVTRPVPGSIRLTVPSSWFATQTAPRRPTMPAGPRPTATSSTTRFDRVST